MSIEFHKDHAASRLVFTIKTRDGCIGTFSPDKSDILNLNLSVCPNILRGKTHLGGDFTISWNRKTIILGVAQPSAEGPYSFTVIIPAEDRAMCELRAAFVEWKLQTV